MSKHRCFEWAEQKWVIRQVNWEILTPDLQNPGLVLVTVSCPDGTFEARERAKKRRKTDYNISGFENKGMAPYVWWCSIVLTSLLSLDHSMHQAYSVPWSPWPLRWNNVLLNQRMLVAGKDLHEVSSKGEAREEDKANRSRGSLFAV